MTDLELIDKVCDLGLDMISPMHFRELEARRLTHFLNYLGTANPDECKAIIRARMSQSGRYTGHPEIERIADVIACLERKQSELSRMKMTDAVRVLRVLEEMRVLSEEVRDYFKPVRIPS